MLAIADEIKEAIVARIRKEVPAGLYYHSAEHTLDVADAAISLCKKENMGADESRLITIAALFHDSGFMISYKDHEQNGCEIAKQMLLAHHYPSNEIEEVCKMIMATKLPQTPLDKLSEILCDADLDYLGRDDYFPISDKLYRELLHVGVLKTEQEWQTMQINFLESHHYFTETARNLREKKKAEHLKIIRNSVVSK